MTQFISDQSKPSCNHIHNHNQLNPEEFEERQPSILNAKTNFFDPLIRIEKTPIEVSNSQLIDNEHGAGVFFIGRVRNRNCGKDVVAVEYDSYIPLAIKTLATISHEAQTKFGTARIEVYHRIGRLNVGEISVAIVVSTPHRDESYKISRYVIEEIKTRAPIWKKEFYTDGETEWLKGHALCQHSK